MKAEIVSLKDEMKEVKKMLEEMRKESKETKTPTLMLTMRKEIPISVKVKQ